MRKEDTIINYRPELVNVLQKDLEFINSYYSKNFQQMYYTLLSIICEKQNDKEGQILFQKMVKWLNSYDFIELFEEHKDEFLNYGIYDVISNARAFYIINNVYKKEIYSMIDKIDMSNLTKMEQYMVKDFYLKMYAPMKNPNIEIKPGHSKCYYDEHYGEFEKDFKFGVEFVNKECSNILEIFNTPD